MRFQGPTGTRDFYPEQMAWRRWLEGHWCAASIRNGFEEVEGPIFEPLDLYKVKSGDEIVSQVFQVTRQEGSGVYAIRPEFTPTLARMVAEKAHALPKPIKWFCMPNLCRGERPQRGRLREFLQWNIDMLGLDDPLADAEVIFTAVDLLASLGLEPKHVRVKISHRDVVRRILLRLGVPDERMLDVFNLLDRRDKMEGEAFTEAALKLGLDADTVERFNQVARIRIEADSDWQGIVSRFAVPEQDVEDLTALHEKIEAFGIGPWCEYDLGIVRGLAYYTGTVFEIHEVSGAERAIAGGGRYDQLIETFGGPPTPAVGFGMGDVVLSLVLADKKLLPADVAPPVDVFILALTDAGAQAMPAVTSMLRRAGLHTRFSYKTTRKIGKLLKDAEAVRARYALLLDDAVTTRRAALKDLASGEQTDVSFDDLSSRVGTAHHKRER